MECDFSDVNQCGYVDVSEGNSKWLRVYDPLTGDYGARINQRQADKQTCRKIQSYCKPEEAENTCILLAGMKTTSAFLTLAEKEGARLMSPVFATDVDQCLQFRATLPVLHYEEWSFSVAAFENNEKRELLTMNSSSKVPSMISVQLPAVDKIRILFEFLSQELTAQIKNITLVKRGCISSILETGKSIDLFLSFFFFFN